MREVILDADPANNAPFQLPEAIVPIHYDIEVEPELVDKKLRGLVQLDFEVAAPTKVIVFHALRLDITDASITLDAGSKQLVPRVGYTPEHEAAYVELDEELSAGSKGRLTLRYVGQLTGQASMGGLFPSPYQFPGGEIKWGFETMMQPTMARAVYPCLDEPDRKATFSVSLIVDPDLKALSNMEVADEQSVTTQSGQKKKVSFKITPKMSTYLVVMIGGYFNVLETDEFTVPVRVWTPPDKDVKDATYALEVAVKALRTHEKNFDLPYPLPKLDMVAIPGHGGGMEHWGCVSYDETLLIFNDNSSAGDEQNLQAVITHELAHQWFGNIVTAKGWGTIWLNESFADWATFYALTEMYPNFDYWASFLADDPSEISRTGFQEALRLDSNRGSHAIEDPNLPPNESFDSIAYLKGCSMVRMIAENLGPEVFLKGVSQYLKEHLYGNATTEDLWDALGRVSGKDVAGTMATWIRTVGYPVLQVEERPAEQEIVLTQSRFLHNGEKDATNTVYPVTVHMKTPNGITGYQMNERQLVLPYSDSYKLNAGLTGFYRVSYPASRVSKLAQQFPGQFLSTEDKVGIISDLGAIVVTGAPDRTVTLSTLLDFIWENRDHGEDLFVWRQVLSQLARVQSAFLFEPKKTQEALQKFRFKLLAHFLDEPDKYFELRRDDTLEQTMFKTLLFTQLKDHPVVQKKAADAWEKLMSGDKDALNGNLRKAIFQVVVSVDQTGDTWDKVKSVAYYRKYLRSTDPITHLSALQALGNTRSPQLIQRALAILTPGVDTDIPIGFNRRIGILRSLKTHAEGASAAWDWLRANWDALYKQQNKGGLNSNYFITAALAGLATKDHVKEVEEFFADKKGESFDILVTQALDEIRTKAAFVEEDRDRITAFVEHWE
ncbi:hypothetical protein GQ53DRAFT_731990 [Thozetella sp. PMI_491]|nr:hypothetical protein GQ53DRAFT_731990 [Thozetella sp. PMI_491]